MQSQSVSPTEANLHAIDYWQVLKNRYGVIFLTFLLVFFAALIVTHVMPKKYESKALVEVRPIQNQETTVLRTNSNSPLMTRQFLTTQFEIILAAKTLERAVEKIQLDKHWDMEKEDVLRVLKGIVSTNQLRGTDLIEIIVRHRNKADAKAVATAVYAAYEEYRKELELSQREGALDAISIQLEQKKDRVTLMKKRLIDIAEKLNVVYIDTERGGQTQGINTNLIDISKEQLYELEKDYKDVNNRLQKLLDVQEEDLIGVAASLPDVGFRQAYDALELAKTDLGISQASGLGNRHPNVVASRNRIADMTAGLAERAKQIRKGLTFELATLESQLKNMRSTVDREIDKGTEKSREIQEYTTALKEYDNEFAQKDAMQLQYDLEKSNLALPITNIIVHETPKISNRPVSPNVTLNLALGLVVGLAFGVGIAFALELLDTSVKGLEDVEKFLGVPVLAVIPKEVGILHKENGMSPDAEAYRILRTNIEFNRNNPEDNAISVVSGGAGEGKSTTITNLAYICAQGGYTTLIIDADLRRPRLHTFFDINNSVGLTNYLTTDLLLEDVVLKTPVENLFFMASGILPSDAAGILNSRRMSELMTEVKSRFDLVFVDSPPILGVSDASVVASEVDHTMIVIQHRKLPKAMILRVKQAVENVGGNVIGAVLNNVDVKSDSQYQYYTSYYSYYSPTTGEEAPKKSKNEPSQLASNSKKGVDAGEDLY